MSIKVVIIEDEELSALKLEKLLLDIDPNIQITEILDSVEKSVFFLENNFVDLIFLDIELSDGTGLDILQKTKTKIPIIFTTAYNQYALDAFKHTSVDYLLKPINKNELKKSIEKYHRIFKKEVKKENPYQDLISFFQERESRILGIKGKSKYPILYKDISYFYIEDRIVWLIHQNGEKYYVNYKLEELENMLPNASFFRANRKVIVSISSIIKMDTLAKSRIKLHLNPPPHFDVMVSSENSSTFKNWLHKN